MRQRVGLIVPDDGSPDVRRACGAVLAVNRQGPIAHREARRAGPTARPRDARGTVTAVKPAESERLRRPDAGGDDVFVAFGDVVDHARLATGDRVEYELVSNEVRGVGVKGGNVVVLPARTISRVYRQTRVLCRGRERGLRDETRD